MRRGFVVPRREPQERKPSSRSSRIAFSKAWTLVSTDTRPPRHASSLSPREPMRTPLRSGPQYLSEEKSPPEQTSQRGFCGSELHRLPPIDEENGNLCSKSICKIRIRVHVHFRELERELAPQPFAERPELLAQVASGPAVQFEVERLLGHRGDARTVSCSRRRVNATLRPSAREGT